MAEVLGLRLFFHIGCRCILDDCSLEEIRVHTAMHVDDITKGEIPEIIVCHETFIDHFIGFDHNLGHVGNVPVTNI